MKIFKAAQVASRAQSSSRQIENNRIYQLFNTLRDSNRITWSPEENNWVDKADSLGFKYYHRSFLGIVSSGGSIGSIIPSYRLLIDIDQGDTDPFVYKAAHIALLFNRTMSPVMQDMERIGIWLINGNDLIRGKLWDDVMAEFSLSLLKLPHTFAEEKAKAGEGKIKAKTRLTRTRRSKRNIDATSLDIFIEPKRTSGHQVYYQVTHLETSVIDSPHLIKETSENGKELTPQEAQNIMDKYIEYAKSNHYVDKTSLEYIPEGANAQNFDFILNEWKEASPETNMVLVQDPLKPQAPIAPRPAEENLEELMGKNKDIIKTSQTQTSFESLPGLADFVHEITSTDRATMGNYKYKINRMHFSGKLGYGIVEYTTDINKPIRKEFLQDRHSDTNNRTIATIRVSKWAMERKYQKSPKQKLQTPPEDIPVKDEEIPPENREVLELLGKNKDIIKTSQNFEGYFTGNVPEYATQFLGSSAVESSQINAMFGKANDAVTLVNQFDSSLLYNISFIFNFAKSGAYGVYLSELDRAIKTQALQKKLEQKGYEVKTTQQGLTAYPKKDANIAPEAIQQDIDSLYADLESKGGTAIGINMSAVLNAARQDAMESGSQDPEVWQWIAVLHLGGTIAHEAVHAKGNMSEGPSEQIEQSFTNWALPKINEQYKQSLEGQGKGDQYTPLTVTGRQRHAKNKTWYKTAQATQLFEIRNRLTNEVIYSATTTSLRLCVEQAVRSRAYLSGADLSGANLSEADLSGANLSGADLSRADLSGANLHVANLTRANLSRANLSRAYLSRADLSGAYLSRADLSGAYLHVANLSEADLSNANLSEADLSNANLSEADLSNANLSRADLSRANLSGAYLSRADLSGAINVNLEGALHTNTIIREERPAPKTEKTKPKEQEKPKEPEDVPVRDEEIPPENREILELLGKDKKSWYKTAQLSYYIPQSFSETPMGSDIRGRFPVGLQSEMAMQPWSMLAQEDQSIPIENRLGRQYMSKIPKDLNQEDDIIEEQLRKYTREDQKLDPKATMEELLSAGWDEDRGYTTTEGLLDEKRPKPLMVTLKRASVNREINSQDNTVSKSLPSMNDFDRKFDTSDKATMGEYNYKINSAYYVGSYGFEILEYTTDISKPIRKRFLAGHTREEAIDLCRRWAVERKNQMVLTPIPKPPEDVPVKDEEIPPENREILELLGKNKKLIKTSQAAQLFEIRNRNTNEVIYSSTTTSLRLCVEQAVRSRVNLSRANLFGANLTGANLSGAYLSGAYLSGANLFEAYLSGANLTEANLSNANLSEADLSEADLSGANLSGANLSEANLFYADLSRANLFGANLTGAYLSRANLFGAYLSRANLFGANLTEANLSGANLSEANLFRADLSRADLSGAINVNLEGALHTNTIIREERPAPKTEKTKPKEQEKPKEPEDTPVKDEEIPPENREILELLGKNKKLIKTATLFGWMNNLDLSDGSTIPGLGDRVMAWEDRDESFAGEEEWIKQQPRYNPTYDIKGFYYRWIEPRFQPQLFDDMTRDYSNTHPAKRFASVKIEPEVARILSILSKAKSKISKGHIASTRFIVTEDVMPVIDKIFPDGLFKINVFHCDTINKEDIYAVWISNTKVNEESIERAEKHLQRKSIDKDIEKLIDELTGISKQSKEATQEILELVKETSSSHGLQDLSITNSISNNINCLEFKGGFGDQCMRIGGLVAEKLGIYNVSMEHNVLSFFYKNIIVSFKQGE